MRSSLVALFLAGPLAAQAAAPPRTGGPFPVELAKPKTTYQLFVPANYSKDRSWPLLVGLHPARTPATAAMNWWLPEGKLRGYIIVCPKAKGDRWKDDDGKIVLAALQDARKRYRVDPDRIAIGGYSSGAFMATRWGLRQDNLWRVVFAHAGAVLPGSLKVAKQRMAVCLTCGDQDQFLASATKARDALQKAKVPLQWELFPGMTHYKTTPQVWKTGYEFFERHFDSSSWRLQRGSAAYKDKRFADAILALEPLSKRATKADRRPRAAALKLLKKIDQAGAKMLKRASTLLAKNPKEAKSLLARIQRQFSGRPVATKARDLK